MGEHRVEPTGVIGSVIRFCLDNPLIVSLALLFTILWGLMVAPFDWDVPGIPRVPVAVDAIPDIGENQQIVFSQWMGRSPKDVEDQITYPLTVALLGIPGVKTIRSYSFFGFSSIYIVFKEEIDFYWSRSRILEKLSSLPPESLPDNVSPALGPDATALGQVFWYTLEGRDENNQPSGGWDLHELRSIQDWTVRYALQSAEGVSEVASIGGFVQEYQIDVDPDAMFSHNVTLEEVFHAVKMSNLDVGARTIEINKAEYIIRGLGFVKNIKDLEDSVVKVNQNIPITVKRIATVSLGPALRRGALDKEGAEAVGGVVVARYGDNPLKVIQNLKEKIDEISLGLPEKTLENGVKSKVKIVPFYDRTELINETLGTLNTALTEEILVTIIVILFMLLNFGSSFLVSGLLPIAVLACFVAMKVFAVDANIMALSGIAIAIGTMVDMGIVVSENIFEKLKNRNSAGKSVVSTLDTVFAATQEVGGAVVTAILTTVVSFLPVFTMTGAEGKMFKPLAYTKTFALLASVIVALTIIPTFAHFIFATNFSSTKWRRFFKILLVGVVGTAFIIKWWLGLLLILGVFLKLRRARIWQWILNLLPQKPSDRIKKVIVSFKIKNLKFGFAILLGLLFLASHWMPLGPMTGLLKNTAFVSILIMGVLFFFSYFQIVYPRLLAWTLVHKGKFLLMPVAIFMLGMFVWLGFDKIMSPIAMLTGNSIQKTWLWKASSETFPGLSKEFMPPFDEGSFLFMPTTMPHASIGESLDVIQKQDKLIRNIPEVSSVVGKLGRVESSLDPAPVSMIETIIAYHPEFKVDAQGQRMRFRFDVESENYIRDEEGNLVSDKNGRFFRNWRDRIKTPDDIWKEIIQVTKIPGTTSAPKLQPIAARIVMLQSGMRAPMGLKIKGPDLETIEKVGLKIEALLKEVPSIEPAAVFADRIVGKPYLEIEINRGAIARYGLSIQNVQNTIEIAVGGKKISTSVEGRERYPIRVRYQRELRDSIESLEDILVSAKVMTKEGERLQQIPLSQLATINYVRGPQVIKSEDTFLVGYVLLDKKEGFSEVDVVEDAEAYLSLKIKSGDLTIPPGVSYRFSGTYENQIRSEKTLMVVLPLALFLIFLILYFQFKKAVVTGIVFSGIFVAWSGGFIMLWLYAQPWFLNFSVFGTHMQTLFQIHPIHLSVAVWVGFIALFGIASDDGVIMATYIQKKFSVRKLDSVEDVRGAVMEAGKMRIRPCLMTTATTILALIPVLTSTGKGSDIMVPMAIPSIGGMAIEIMTLFVVPVLYSMVKEREIKKRGIARKAEG